MKLRATTWILLALTLAVLSSGACNRVKTEQPAEVKEVVMALQSQFRVPADSVRWVGYLTETPQDTARAWLMLGALYLANEHTAVALDYLNRALAIDPGRPVLQLNLADAYNRLGEREKAVDALRLYMRFNPDSPFGPEIFRIVEKYRSIESEKLIP
ncbi:tetratricopeptide repeat protein [bacterium]|nr:tetratricopeptide repeat protein [bacterium]